MSDSFEYSFFFPFFHQEDVVMGTLSIKENLEFSAALRLPQNVSKVERDERVHDILEELGLTHVADSKVRFTVLNEIMLS